MKHENEFTQSSHRYFYVRSLVPGVSAVLRSTRSLKVMSHLAWWNKPVTAAGEIDKTEKSKEEGNNSYFSLISKNLWLLNGGDDNDTVSEETHAFFFLVLDEKDCYTVTCICRQVCYLKHSVQQRITQLLYVDKCTHSFPLSPKLSE